MKKIFALWFLMLGAAYGQTVTFSGIGGGGTTFTVSIVPDHFGDGGVYYRVSAATPSGKAYADVRWISGGTGDGSGLNPSSGGGSGVGATAKFKLGAEYRLSVVADSPGTGEAGNFHDYGQYTTFTTPDGPAELQKSVTVSLKNDSDIPRKYKLMHGETQIGSTLTLAPGQQIIQKIPLPSGVEPEDVSVIAFYEGYEVGDGGSWIVKEGAVTTIEVISSGTIPNSAATEDEDEPTPEQIVNVPQPAATPSGGAGGPTSGGTVWNEDKPAEEGDGLTRQTFREGIDKLQKTLASVRDAINGTPQTPVTFDSTAPTDYIMPMVTVPVIGAIAKLPDAPAISLPTSSSTFAMSFTPPGLTGSQTISIDLAEYDTGINIFKAIVRAVLAVWFFFIAVKTIRGAFAG